MMCFRISGTNQTLRTGGSSGGNSGQDLYNLVNEIWGVGSGVVARAGGGIPNATPMTSPGPFNQVATVASNNDSVTMEPAVPGNYEWVDNAGASTLAIYSLQANAANANNAADVIVPHGSTAANADNVAITLATGHSTLFICFTAGVWKQIADWS